MVLIKGLVAARTHRGISVTSGCRTGSLSKARRMVISGTTDKDMTFGILKRAPSELTVADGSRETLQVQFVFQHSSSFDTLLLQLLL
jgi:hypothetical protein